MLAAILAVGAGSWVGGLLTVAVLASSSRRTVAAADRVALFRDFGRRFALLFGVTALFVVAPALVLAVIDPGPLSVSILLLTLGLLLATAAGILQARRMTGLRATAATPSGEADAGTLRRNAAVAAALRGILALGYIAVLVLAVLLVGTT